MKTATKLKVYVRGEVAACRELAEGKYVLGRSRSAEILLTEPDISGKHLEIRVGGDRIFASNLSSHGSLLDGAPLSEEAPFEPGMKISLGKNTTVELDNGDATVIVSKRRGDYDPLSQTANTLASIPLPAPAPAAEEPPPRKDRFATVIPDNRASAVVPEPPAGNVDSVYQTDIMKTRLASIEELEILRKNDKKKTVGRFARYIILFLLILAGLILAYSIKKEPPEEHLSWPADSGGKYLGAFFDPGNGGFERGNFSLAYPSLPGKTKAETKGDTITVTTRVGRNGEVPLRIIFVSRSSPEFLTRGRKEVFGEMLKQLQKENNHWNLAQISEVFYIGGNNGLPCLSAEYRRETDQESWYGEALFFRTGNRACVRLAEVPLGERIRAQRIISGTPFLKFSAEYIEKHWEGSGSILAGDAGSLLNEVNRHLSKQAPFEWQRTNLLLKSLLVTAVEQKNTELEEEATLLLRQLRKQQTTWYNSQKINFENALLHRNLHQQAAIMELCKSVFSSPDDLRYQSLRRNKWE